MRGVQFASRFSLVLAQETAELCRTLSLADLSVERLFEEFKKWLLKPGKPSMGLGAFLDVGLDGFFPEVVPYAGSWEVLGNLMDNMADVRAAAPVHLQHGVHEGAVGAQGFPSALEQGRVSAL